MFSHALHGNYTNFGVFELYSDGMLRSSTTWLGLEKVTKQ